MKFVAPSARHAERLTALAFRAKAHWGYPSKWLELRRAGLIITPERIEREWIEVAVDADGEWIGFFSIDPALSELVDLWVEPERIGAGFGGLLLRRAMACAAAGALEGLKIVSDPHAEGFYRHMGGRRLGEVESVPAGRYLPVLQLDLE